MTLNEHALPLVLLFELCYNYPQYFQDYASTQRISQCVNEPTSFGQDSVNPTVMIVFYPASRMQVFTAMRASLFGALKLLDLL